MVGEGRLGELGSDRTVEPPRWETIASAPPIHLHTATLLKDGSAVLLAGGEQKISTTSFGTLVTETWLYEVATRKFVPLGKLALGRTNHTATLLADGRVLLAGGSKDHYTVYSDVQIFDPVSRTWSPGKPLPGPREKHEAVVLKDGKVALIGGSIDLGDLDTIAIFDPVTSGWSTPGLAKLKAKRAYHSATLLGNGKVVIAGGVQGGSEVVWLDSIEIWDPGSGTVTASAARLSQPRAYQTAHLLPKSGNVLLIGGLCGSYNLCTLAGDELFDPSVDKATALPHHGLAPMSHASVSLPDGRVVVTGGSDGAEGRKAVVFDPQSTAWSDLPDLPGGREFHTATRIDDRTVLVVGGRSPASRVTLDTAGLLFNP